MYTWICLGLSLPQPSQWKDFEGCGAVSKFIYKDENQAHKNAQRHAQKHKHSCIVHKLPKNKVSKSRWHKSGVR